MWHLGRTRYERGKHKNHPDKQKTEEPYWQQRAGCEHGQPGDQLCQVPGSGGDDVLLATTISVYWQ